jgi:hypothetical protein
MNDVYELLKTALFFVIALFAGAVGWFLKRHAERIENLEKCTVTHAQFKETLAQMRQDRMDNHHENRAYLERIEHKIDENEVRASKTRHDTKDEVHGLAVQLASLKRDNRNDR